MKRFLILTSFVLLTVLELIGPGPAAASLIVGRDPLHVTLQLDADGRALISYTSAGRRSTFSSGERSTRCRRPGAGNRLRSRSITQAASRR